MRHPSDMAAGGIPWPKVKILVFSQDDAFRFLVRSTFRKMSVKDVLSTSIADDAEHMLSFAPDVAVVDFDNDPRAALEFVARLKGAPVNPNPAMPILVSVRAADRLLVDPALNMGVEGVVPKPVSGHELALRVAETLRQPNRAPGPAIAPEAMGAAKKTPAPLLPTAPKPASMQSAPPQAASPQTAPAQTAPPQPAPAQLGPAKPTAPRPAAPAPVVAAVTPPRPIAPAPRPVTAAVAPVRPAGPIETVALPTKAAPKDRGAIEVVATPKAQAREPSAIEVLASKAPAQYRLEPRAPEDDAAARERAAKRHEAWQAAIAKSGHSQRTGTDVARLDVSAFVAAHLAWLGSQGAEGARANVQGMDLAGADLARTVLANATFREADLSDASLIEARLDGADFRYAKLDAADLAGANLGVAQLRHAKARLTNLEGAILRGADLSGADLRGSRLAGADFKGAMMISTDLRGTDLSQVENLSQAQMDKAVADMKTKLPPGIHRPVKPE